MIHFSESLATSDPDIAQIIAAEQQRQQDAVELIASENFVSRAVLEAQGSVLTNKYAEGYPNRRYYGGCEYVDVAEELARDRASRLFHCPYVNVQPHSGAQANQAVFLALLEPGDCILGMALPAGGHLTHGSPVNVSGKWFRAVQYGVTPGGWLDYDQLAAVAELERPRLIIAGGSAYPRIIDFARIRQIADAVGAYFMVDMAHVAGLVAAELFPSPIPHAHVVTTTTHKTLRGPRGGMILSADVEIGKRINAAVFPGLQGGPLMHVIAAKAVALGEALRPEFRDYQHAVTQNAHVLSDTLIEEGLPITTGGTDTHLMLIDLRCKHVTGKAVEASLGRAGIVVNKNAVANDPEPANTTSGIRIGTPAATTRGFGTDEFRVLGTLIGRVIHGLANSKDGTNVATEHVTHARVRELCEQFPMWDTDFIKD